MTPKVDVLAALAAQVSPVAILAAATAEGKEVTSRLAVRAGGALLYDVGKSAVPLEILHKPARLTPAEFEVMKKHPLIGAEMLLGLDRIDPLCVSVAFSHHILNPHPLNPVFGQQDQTVRQGRNCDRLHIVWCDEVPARNCSLASCQFQQCQ